MVWTPDGQGAYDGDPVVLANWPQGRTCRVAGISETGMIVGYMNPTPDGLQLGQPWVYTGQFGFKWIGLPGQYGAPTAVSDNGAVCGSSPHAWVWRGSPDPQDPNAAPIDVRGFISPEGPVPAVVTGVNSAGALGGNTYTAEYPVWLTYPSECFEVIEPSSLGTIQGSVVSGNVSSLGVADGDLLRIVKFVVPNASTDPVSFEVNGTVVGQPNRFWLRCSGRVTASGSFLRTMEMWDYSSGNWSLVSVRTDPETTTYVTRDIGTGPDTANSIGPGGLVRARVRAGRLNNLREVVSDTSFHFQYWRPKTTPLYISLAFSNLVRDINDDGVTVGRLEGSTSGAFIWDKELGIRELVTPPGRTGVEAFGINNNGDVVGIAYGFPVVGFIWNQATGYRLFPGPFPPQACSPDSVNDFGVVLCFGVNNTGRYSCYSWTANAGFVLYEQPPGMLDSFAEGISNTGKCLFFCYGQDLDLYGWVREPNGAWTALRPFTDPSSEIPRSINDSGEVVGECGTTSGIRAIYWDPTGKGYELNWLLDATGRGWNLLIATDINNRGDIIAYGTHYGIQKTCLLMRVPRPLEQGGLNIKID